MENTTLQGYLDQADELGLKLYDRSYDHDVLLTKWWMELTSDSGDFYLRQILAPTWTLP